MPAEVLAMYDVRGIQDYIFRTSKLRDAIGASEIVEDMFERALHAGCQQEKKVRPEIKIALEWADENGVKELQDGMDIQVLYIGGGNAVVIYSSRDLCIRINKRMAGYLIRNTYSLQLASAIVDKTDNYSEDYRNLYLEMAKVKDRMVYSAPLGALPVMETEVKTGLPAVKYDSLNGIALSTESLLKREAGLWKQKDIELEARSFDSYVTKKGKDSLLAVVHIDGNNMGLRIRYLIQNETDYKRAAAKMRTISWNINHSYKKVFDEMEAFFTANAVKSGKLAESDAKWYIRKIITAGDDITYVCNANIALATIQYFAEKISKMTLNGETDSESIRDFGFSVCGGAALIGSHFPFDIAYDVAEECCESAKKRAKTNKDNDRVGNYMDFQFCRNIQTRNLDQTRKEEYITPYGENLIVRPFYIRTEYDGNLSREDEPYAFSKFEEAVKWFSDETCIPRSFAKRIRNTYSLGEKETELFHSFLKSRGKKMPGDSDEMYYCDENGIKHALWYDALEMMDNYIPLSSLSEEEAAQ